MSSALEIEARAAHWLARRQEPGWSAADEAGLDAWLRESTAHEVAYLRLEYGWSKADRLAALRRPSAVSQLEATPPPSVRRHRLLRRPLVWSAAAAALLLSVVLLVSYGDLFPRDVYATSIGEHEIVPLPDGSRIELNTDTRVRTDFTPQARSVWLERGEAYFEVAREPSRPFVVYAGGRRVTVLGTKFSVRLDPNANRMQLAVTEGRVQLEELRPQVPAPPMVAIGGDKVIAEGASMRVESRSVEAVSIDLSWRQGLLRFDQTTLAAAAEEFNRYNRRRLVVEPTAAGIHIGGSFEAANVDAFARLLQQGFGLQVVESGDEIRISE
jgi:transmembrane sensor